MAITADLAGLGKNASEKAFLSWLESSRTEGRTCPFCHNPAWWTGVFLPEDSQLWGAPLGKMRVIAYPGCNGCKQKFGEMYLNLIELYIARQLSEGVPVWG